MLLRIFAAWFKFTGWTVKSKMPDGIKKCVICAAPHTSNWDLVYAMAFCHLAGLKIKFTIKNEWMRWPFKSGLESLGAIGIDRGGSSKTRGAMSYTDMMAELFEEQEELMLIIQPEGTRSFADHWKKGFYVTAQKSGVPIALAYLDYEKKTAGVGKVLYPSGDYAKDLREMVDFFKTISPKIPKNFNPNPIVD